MYLTQWGRSSKYKGGPGCTRNRLTPQHRKSERNTHIMTDNQRRVNPEGPRVESRTLLALATCLGTWLRLLLDLKR